VIRGTDGRDVINGQAGNDTIVSFGGDDVICSGDGIDNVRSGSGDDVVLGEPGPDEIRTASGDDDVRASGLLFTGSGDDDVHLTYGSIFVRVDTRGGEDNLTGSGIEGSETAVFEMGDGSDEAFVQANGSVSDILLRLGPGDDDGGADAYRVTVAGGSGDDRVGAYGRSSSTGSGGSGSDYLYGLGSQLGILLGGLGQDRMQDALYCYGGDGAGESIAGDIFRNCTNTL
jgi:Ca2+-binding RTX toxin-like protein